MTAHRRWFLTSFSGSALILAAVIWILFAPTPLGGQVNYVVIDGNSMEPAIHKSDLIIVRQADEYHAGDAVAYWNPLMKRYVFHRIVGVGLDRYTFKGDHNSWLDSYSPVRSELVGKQWIVLPNFGKVLEWIRPPIHLALIVTALGGILMAFALNNKSRKRKEPFDPIAAPGRWFVKIQKQTPNKPSETRMHRLDRGVEIGFFVLGLAALASLVLGAFAFFNPLTITTMQNFPYSQKGAYSYTANTSSGIYDSAGIQTGDPVFTRLTCQVDLVFDYALSAEGIQTVSGTHQLTAVLTEMSSGWRRSFPLEAKQNFSGSAFSARGTIDLCRMQTLADQMEEQTGITAAGYQIAVYPNVDVTGNVQDIPISEHFTTPLVFQFTKVRASLAKPEPGVDPVNPVIESMVSKQIEKPKTLAISFIDLPVSIARMVAGIGLAIAMLGLFTLVLVIGNASKNDPEVLIRMKYGSIIVDVEPDFIPIDRAYVDVSSIDDLARVAEKNNTVILHQCLGNQHIYQVQGERFSYRYAVNPERPIAEIKN